MTLVGVMIEPRYPAQIECLSCGEVRSVHGFGRTDTGECPRCHYVGWAYADELDERTQRQIMNGSFATPQRRQRGGVRRPGSSRFR
jgi:hypothetical protein